MKNRIRKKLILLYSTILIAIICILACTSFLLFRRIYSQQTYTLMNDQILQMTENLEYRIKAIEDKSFDILTNSAIQQQLTSIANGNLSPSDLLRTEKSLQTELSKIILFSDDIVSCSVVSDTGEKVTVDRKFRLETPEIFSKEEIYQKNGSSMWGLDSQTMNIMISRAILNLDTMKILGYLNIECKGSYFSNITLSGSGTIYLVNNEEWIVESNDRQQINQPLPLSDIPSDSASSFANGSKKDFLCRKSRTLANGWTLVIAIPYAELFSGLRLFLCLTIIIGVLALAVGLLGVYTISCRTMHPIEVLLKSMKEFGKGDFSKRVHIEGKDEIAQLGCEYNSMAENIENLVEKVLKMEITQQQAELEFLKMQINPHFLFNTLDTINWMAISSQNMEISEMVMALAELLRTTLKSDTFVPIETELRTVKNYLMIQEYRFRDKIEVKYIFDENLNQYKKSCMLPSLILQPLIENAINHGLEPKITTGMLTLKIYLSDCQIYFEVQDDGIGIAPQKLKELREETLKELHIEPQKSDKNSYRSGIGLKNVNRRLFYYYGKQSTLQISSKEGTGTIVSFSIPIFSTESS